MAQIVTNKLAATVVGFYDLGEQFPASVLKGRIGLDVRVQRGSLSPGKSVRLSGPGWEEEIEIVGIEMLSDPHDPNLVRVVCAKTRIPVLPPGKVEGWSVAED
jgi:hypothetical protein